VRRADNLTTFTCRESRNFGSLNLLQSPRACPGLYRYCLPFSTGSLYLALILLSLLKHSRIIAVTRASTFLGLINYEDEGTTRICGIVSGFREGFLAAMKNPLIW
jgi:hypothetical protein